MNEFEKLNGHVRQFLRHQQPMRQLTLDVLHGNEYCFIVINKENCLLSVTVVYSINRFSNF